MNDMSRPAQVPTTHDHEHHDALLVSRLAADDPLDQADYRKAMALVSGCTECASLAADLRTVATAIAWEPVPPRRRDFRLSPEQAERARGSGLQRLMRRLAMPQSNGLRPLAAGVMSLGLVLVVAGSFWPQDVFDGAIQQEVAAPSTSSVPTAETTSATTPPRGVGEQDASLGQEPGASSQARPVDTSAGTSGDSRAQPPDAASDDGVADDAAGLALEATVEEVASDTSRSDAGLSQPESPETNSLTQELAVPELSAKTSSSPIAEAISDAAAAALPSSATPAAQVPDVGSFADTAERQLDGDALGAGQAEGELGDSAELAISRDDGISIETAVVAVGLGLVVVGLSLWLLVWMARRRDRDPLAR